MKAVVPLAALTLGACSAVSSGMPGPTAGIGKLVYVNGIKVRPLEVLEDSRCPGDVVCVWPGRVIVRSVIIGGTWSETRDLELGKAERIADGAITLVAVAPGKKAGVEADPRAYRFTFDFQGGI